MVTLQRDGRCCDPASARCAMDRAPAVSQAARIQQGMYCPAVAMEQPARLFVTSELNFSLVSFPWTALTACDCQLKVERAWSHRWAAARGGAAG